MVVRGLQVVAGLGLLAVAACGDDAPTVKTSVIPRAASVAHASQVADVVVTPDDTRTTDSDAPQDTGPVVDSGPTPDTGPPAETTSPTDTSIGPDTSLSSDLQAPAVLAIPWVAAGAGGASAQLLVTNGGGAVDLAVQLVGDSRLSLTNTPQSIDQRGSAAIVVAFSGAQQPTVAHAALTVTASDGDELHIDVYGVAGDPTIGAATWEEIDGPHGGRIGYGATLGLPTAPYPDIGGSWTDDRVHIFVPEDHRDRDAVDVVVHFHGHGTTLAETLPAHQYREQLVLSGANAVLVVPQGPVEAASGNFGKLMDDGGLEALLADVVAVLYRDGLVLRPLVGDLVLTSHSGGYQAVAENLDVVTDTGVVTDALLFDSLYAREAAYVAFVRAGGRLRSNYTATGGTRDDNEDTLATLGALAVSAATQRNLRDAAAILWFVATSHGDVTRYEGAYAETLRWSARRSRRGPRVELRAVTAAGGTALARWFSPNDDDVVGFAVETSLDGEIWTIATTVAGNADRASIPIIGTRIVRVVPITDGVAAVDALPSDAYAVSSGQDVVVVDGFDRALEGSFFGLSHGFSGRVGRALTGVDSLSNEALTEDGEALSDWPAAVWLLGDESTRDHTFTAAEQALIDAYLDAGGGIVVSGSEVAWDLDRENHGEAFLNGLGARYAADNSGTHTVSGVGPLSDVGTFTFGGAGGGYEEDFPDVLAAESGATVLLQYHGGQAAAVGIAGRSVVVGFPLELIDDEATRTTVVRALVDYVK